MSILNSLKSPNRSKTKRSNSKGNTKGQRSHSTTKQVETGMLNQANESGYRSTLAASKQQVK